MSDRKCIELTAVYDDGTVERWEEWDAAAILDKPKCQQDSGTIGLGY